MYKAESKYNAGDVVVGDAIDKHRMESHVQRHDCVFHSVVEGYMLETVPHNVALGRITDFTIVDVSNCSGFFVSINRPVDIRTWYVFSTCSVDDQLFVFNTI